MMMQLQKYNLRVVYKRGSEMYADTLSRAYMSAPNQVSEEEQEFIRAVENVKMTKHLSKTLAGDSRENTRRCN